MCQCVKPERTRARAYVMRVVDLDFRWLFNPCNTLNLYYISDESLQHINIGNIGRIQQSISSCKKFVIVGTERLTWKSISSPLRINRRFMSTSHLLSHKIHYCVAHVLLTWRTICTIFFLSIEWHLSFLHGRRLMELFARLFLYSTFLQRFILDSVLTSHARAVKEIILWLKLVSFFSLCNITLC